MEEIENQDREPTSLGGHGLTSPVSSPLPIANMFRGSDFNPRMSNSGTCVVLTSVPNSVLQYMAICVTRNKAEGVHQKSRLVGMEQA